MTIWDGLDIAGFVAGWLGRCAEIVCVGGSEWNGGSEVTGFETGWVESRFLLISGD